jgi:hypothetical protein
VKSALMSTAGVAYGDTARTAEAPVLLEGAGLAYLPRADDPKIFTQPQSLSLHELNFRTGTVVKGALVTVFDAGNGSGTWGVTLAPQAATKGVGVDVPPSITLAPGGTAALPFTARAEATAQPGPQFGFVVLTRGQDVRRIPYFFLAEKPRLQEKPAIPLRPIQVGTTAKGTSHANSYCCPSTPFGPAPDFVSPPLNEDGAETLYITHLQRTAVNIGVSVIAAGDGAVIDPYFLGSKDENDVQGYGGLPINVNAYMFDYRFAVGAAGAQFPLQRRFFVSVDSGRDRFTNKRLAGQFLLRSWVNDVEPPVVQLLTPTVSAGRPLLALRIGDLKSGVDPYSLVISYNRALVGAALYDPFTGLALFPLPAAAPEIAVGKTAAILVASDFQETKNVDQAGGTTQIMPNTTFAAASLTAVAGPAVNWLLPGAGECAAATQRLVATASSNRAIRQVRFLDGKKVIGTVKKGVVSLYALDWKTAKLTRGKHTLVAEATDAGGKVARDTVAVNLCKS